jgi:anti-sigma factor RsiW
MGPDQQRLSPADRENLVAYIDGELNEAEARAISTKLTHSVTARREIELLEITWKLLDNLPMPRATGEFTARTLSEAEGPGGSGKGRDGIVRRLAVQVLATVLVVIGTTATFLGGYAATTRLWPHPTERLADDLSIAEHLDEYVEAGSFEFLEQLDKLPDFNQD